MNLLREDYLAIADGDYCAARLLNVFERWHNTKLDHRSQARYANAIARSGGEHPDQDEGLWVYMSNEELRRELMNEYSEKPVTRALTLLEGKGFLRRRSNPLRKWDRKPQYLFVAAAVQKAINAWAASREEGEDAVVDDPAEMTDSIPQIDGVDSADLRSASRTSADSIPQIDGVDPALAQDQFRTSAASTPSKSASNTTGFKPQVSSTGFKPQEEHRGLSSSFQQEEKTLDGTDVSGGRFSDRVLSHSPVPNEQDVPRGARALLERYLGGNLSLANLLLEVPASGVDRRQWLKIPESRIQAIVDEAHAQETLVFRTYLIRALDVEIGSSLSLPGRVSPQVVEKDDARELLRVLHEGDLVRSRKTGSTFRVASVTSDGIDIEVPGYSRPVSVSVSHILGYERVD